MTKARIRAIRAMIETPFTDDRDDALTECLAEIERFQKILRRGDDLNDHANDASKYVTTELVPPAGPAAPTKKSRGTLDEFKAFAKTLTLPESDGEAMFWKFEASGWKNGRNPVKDWKATMRQWKAAGYHPSQNRRGATPPQNPERAGRIIL